MKLLYGVAISAKFALRGENAFKKDEFLNLFPHHMIPYLRKTGKLGREFVLSYRTSLVEVDVDTDNLIINAPIPEVYTPKQQNSTAGSPMHSKASSPRLGSPSHSIRKRKGMHINTHVQHVESPDQESPTSTPSVAQEHSINGRIRGSTNNAPFDVVHRISHYIRKQRNLGFLENEDAAVIINLTSYLVVHEQGN
jgi:hypothetical protein